MTRGHVTFATVLLGALAFFPFEEDLHAGPIAVRTAPNSTGPKQKVPDSLPHLTWADFFAKVETTGATYSDRLKELDGQRVVLKGNAVQDPKPEVGIYLTRNPEARLHPDDEDTLPGIPSASSGGRASRSPPCPRARRSKARCTSETGRSVRKQ